MKRKLLCTLWCMVVLPALAFAQEATITGTITDVDGQPLIGANVLVEELVIGAATDLTGRYSFQVPANQVLGQTVTLRAGYIGFSPQTRTVTLTAGSHTEDFQLDSDLLKLDEVVVTGVSEATPTKKLAFTVAKVDATQLEQVPASNPLGAMQGKVAGAAVVQNTGQPGDALSVRLRGSTSITGTSQPLYIVDGVILGANQVDFDALDIDNIEIVKGAAASSLYGSRAQNGVVQITTKRGSTIPLNQTRVTFRGEYGVSDVNAGPKPNLAHDLQTDGSGNFLNADGVKNTCATCLPNGYGPGTIQNKNEQGAAFYNTPYQGTLHNAFDQFFNPGDNSTVYVGVSQNSAKTNFLASFSRTEEGGSLWGLQGYKRNSVRVNLDHRIASNLTFSSSGFYSNSESDGMQGSIGSVSRFNPFFGIMFTNPLVNLEQRDPDTGSLKVQADPLAVEENPLYLIENTNINNERSRILGNFRARYSPIDWLNVEGNFSYDRSDRDGAEFYDIGFESIDPDDVNNGRVERFNWIAEAINADATASFRKQFNRLTTRAQVKAQLERVDSFSESVVGSDLAAVSIPDLSNVKGEKRVSNYKSTIKSEGYFITGGIDYADKYIADVLFRRDGSSLFGSDERWQNYYRISAAWRLAEEPWWFAPNLFNEFKLRFSLGTAGGRPGFEAQYETFALSDGSLTKNTLGNSKLKPELQTEQEFGVDFTIKDRVFVELVYAGAEIKDQLLLVPLPGFFGFSAQWRNAGTLETDTWEASVNWNVLNQRDMSLDMGFVFDRTRQKITEFDSNAFRGGPETAFYYRKGERLGAMYGNRWMASTSDLSGNLQGTDASWAVNDDGYLVPVGQGNSYTDGVAKQLWGTNVEIGGQSYRWGIPVKYVGSDGSDFVQIGDVLPDFNLGLNATYRYKGFNIYMLWNAQVGGDVYNFTKQWSYRDGRAQDQDQSAKADGMKKSTTYYEVLYDATAKNTHFVEDGTYVKLRELSLGYTFNRRQLTQWFGNALNQVSINVIGRNLLTFSDYTGIDPEVGDSGGGANSTGGDATLYRVDNFSYPHLRTFRVKLEVQF